MGAVARVRLQGRRASGSSSAAASSSSAAGARGEQHGDQPTLEWFEKLTAIGTLEESVAELVLHLRDGGMRFVPCAAGPKERHEVYEIVSHALINLQVAE